MVRVAAFLQSICCDGQHFFLLEQLGDLRRTASLHAEREDAFDHLRGFLVHNPFLRIVRIFHIAIWQESGQRLAALSLCFDNCTDLAAGIAGIELIEPHSNPGKIIVYAVLVERIKVVVDRNVADIMFGKGDVDEHSRHRGISPEPGREACISS